MSKPADNSKFLEAIRASELGEQIARQIEEQRHAERKAVAAELAAINKGAERDFPKLQAAQEAALAAFKKAEAALQEARAKVAQANASKLSASAIYTARRDELERALTDSASPLIQEFIGWAHDEQHATRKAQRVRYWTDTNPVTGKRTDRSESNAASVQARVAALNAAIEAARDMQLLSDQSKVPEALERLRTELPIVKEL